MENYEIVKELGNGLQGSSYLVIHNESDQQFVLKKIECLDESEANCAFQEAFLFKKDVTHDAVNEMVSMFVHWDKELSSMFLCTVSELHSAGDLLTLMEDQMSKNEPIKENLIAKWLAEMIEVINVVHSKGFLHCDLKPSNVLLKSDDSVVLTDFALPTVVSDLRQRTRTFIGSMDYMAPEVAQQSADRLSDIWSMGCVLLHLVMCTFYDTRQMMDQLLAIKQSRAALEEMLTQAKQQSYSAGLIDALRSMLSIEVSKRPDIVQLMQDPYVQSSLAQLMSERDAKISGPCKAFSHGESTLVYMRYIVDNLVNRVCIRNVLEHLWKLAQPDQETLLVLDTSKKQVIVQAIRQHVDDPETAEFGLQILGSQVATAYSADYLFSRDALMVVCDLMKKHPTSASIQRHAIFLLMASSVCENALQHVYQLRGVSLILQTLRSFADDIQLCTSCLNALWSLVIHDGNARLMTEDKGIVDTVAAMTKHKESHELFEAGCAVLVGLTLQDENLGFVNRLNCVGLILSGLELHKKNPKVIRYGCFALAAIVEADEESAYRVISNVYDGQEDIDGISKLIEIYEIHQRNSSSVHSILSLFAELAQYEDIASEMKHLKVGDVVSKARKFFCDNLDILSLCDRVKAKAEGTREVANRLPASIQRMSLSTSSKAIILPESKQ